jgi:hypothetical protein
VDSWTGAAQRIRIRSRQIDDRIRQLRLRNERMVRHRLSRGSTPEQVVRAADFARAALERARKAAQRSVSAHLRAASAHDRAAKRLDELAEAGLGDGAAHSVKARDHRASAQADRDAARACAQTPLADDRYDV